MRFEGVSKYVLRGVNLALEGPGCVALVGPNGSGKTTLLRLAAGIIAPSEGRVRVLGGDPFRDPGVRELVNYVATTPLTDQGESAVDYLRLYYLMTGKGRRRMRVEDALRSVGVPEHLWGPLLKLSEGQRRKVELAKLLIKEAPVNLVDEPTEFLDAASREWVEGLLRRLKGESLILLASHDLSLVKAVADEVLLVEGGRVKHVDVKELEALTHAGIVVRGVAVVKDPSLVSRLRGMGGVVKAVFKPRVGEVLKALGIDASSSTVAVFTSVDEARQAFGGAASFISVSGLRVRYDFEIRVGREDVLRDVIEELLKGAEVEELHVLRGPR